MLLELPCSNADRVPIVSGARSTSRFCRTFVLNSLQNFPMVMGFLRGFGVEDYILTEFEMVGGFFLTLLLRGLLDFFEGSIRERVFGWNFLGFRKRGFCLCGYCFCGRWVGLLSRLWGYCFCGRVFD